MNAAKLKKIISRSTYDKKKKEFTIVFKEPEVAQLVQLMMPEGKRRRAWSKAITFDVSEDATSKQLIALLEITNTIK